MVSEAHIEVKDKKDIFDSVGESLKIDIRDLGFDNVSNVEFIQVYYLEGVFDSEDLDMICNELFSDPVSQKYSINSPFYPQKAPNVFVVEIAYNPGVMDPVESSITKAAEDLGIDISIAKTAKKYIIKGDISEEELKSIAERLLYNKTTQHIVNSTERPPEQDSYTFRYESLNIMDAGDEELLEISQNGQLYLTLDEMRTVKKYFRKVGREPSRCEIETIAQTWSEHCKHKTMMGRINFNGKTIDNLLKQTVMKATEELDLPWCVSVFKDNAGIIEFDENNNICFKVETHNHPSALEPYGGAETGVGGVIRDPLGTGLGARPVMNSDVFCFGYPDMPVEDLPKGCLHPKRVMKGVVSGVRDYGNRMGIPTVNGAVCFDDRYVGNPLVFCGNVGIMPKKYSSKKVSPGELIVLVGGKTGRDGIHGATFSSGELTTASEDISATSVQIGNPITEKKIVDTLLIARDKDLYESITDCGAGGLSSAVGEMGEETGAEVDLEKVPLKYKGLKPWEIWISEAQERMVLSVCPEKLETLMQVFSSEDVEATVIGRFTDTGRLKLLFEGNQVADLDMDFLHNGLPVFEREARWVAEEEEPEIFGSGPVDIKKSLLELLSSWNIASKEWIIRQYDHEVQGGSVLKPLIGENNDGPSDAAISRPLLDSTKAIALACGLCPDFSQGDPYWMAASAIEEALRQIVSVGGDLSRTAILDNFCWGSSEDPDQLGAMVRACQACYDMSKTYGTPFISGKDSLNNEFNTGEGTISIPPTLLISAVSVVNDVSRTISMDVKKPGNLLFIVGMTHNEMGGTQYKKINNLTGGVTPRVRTEMSKKVFECMTEAIREGSIISSHDCSEGGLAVAFSEMLFAGGLGADISLGDVPVTEVADREDVILFSESNSRFVVEVPFERREEFLKKLENVPVGFLGKIKKSPEVFIRALNGEVLVRTDVEELKRSWKRPFKELMHERG